MEIKKPGTVTFWIDPKKNPFAFKEGNNVKWLEFKLDGQHCIIISEGKTLTVIMNPNTNREFMIFQTSIDFDPGTKHLVVVTWSTETVWLYYDKVSIQEVNVSDLK